MAELCRDHSLSLVERKRRQWAEERANQQEWYPFGKPGAGAPLRSPLELSNKMADSLEMAKNPLSAQAAAAAVDQKKPQLIITCNQDANSPGNGETANNIAIFPNVMYPSAYSEAAQMYAAPPLAPGSNFSQACGAPFNLMPYQAGNAYSPAHGYCSPDGTSCKQICPGTTNVQNPFSFTYFNGTPAAAAMSMGHGHPYANSTPCRPVLLGAHTGVHQASPYFSCDMDQRGPVTPPQPVSTAYVTPMLMNNQQQQQQQPLLVSTTDLVSRSMYAGSAGSSLLSIHSDPMSRSCDSNIHKRRNVVTAPKDANEVEEQRLQAMRQKQIFDKQIREKQLKCLQQAEMERREAERVERERREMEYRQMMESEMERSKWRRMKELEELRQHDIEDSWKKAKQEAEMLKHARLMKHATVAQNEDEFVLLPGCYKPDESATSGNQPSLSPMPLQMSQRSECSSDFGRSPSLIPASSPADDRPIKPMAQSPVELWDNLISKQLSSNRAAKEASAVGQQQQQQQQQQQNSLMNRSKNDTASSAVKAKQSSRTSIVRPLLRHKKEKTPEEGSLKAVGFGEKLSRKFSLRNGKSSEKSSPSESPPVTKSKHSAASNLISQFSATLNLASIRKPPKKTKDAAAASSLVATAPLPRKERDSLFVPENPFGDSLGGANPLCQPLLTRAPKGRQSAAAAAASKMTTAPSSSPSSASSSSSSSSAEANASAKQLPFTRSPSVRVSSSSVSNFSSKNPLYQSISSRIRCSTENHRKMLDQLFQLRKQLKDKHRQIEEAILNPVVSSSSSKSNGGSSGSSQTSAAAIAATNSGSHY